MNLGDLKPNLQNPRIIDDAALKRLEKTLAKYGDLSGIVYNRKTGNLVGGHQRLKVLPREARIQLIKEYEAPTVKGTVALGYVEIEGELFTYREVDVDEDIEKGMNIAANKGAGEWDKPALSEWLLELDAKGWDIEETGWSLEEFENLCAPFRDMNFEPGTEDDQGKLDEKNPVTCPKCGETFVAS